MLAPALTVYFIRHGETDWNAAGRLQGQTDIPLNDTGRAQARRNGARLAALGLDPAHVGFLASPLLRTRQTMEIVRDELGLPPRDYATDPLLKELSFGSLEGRTWADIEGHPEHGPARARDPYRWRPPGGESYLDLSERAGLFLKSLTRDAVVVAHGGVSRVLRGHLLDQPPHVFLEGRVPQDKVMILRSGRFDYL